MSVAITLEVPGTNPRYGFFIEALSFDDFIKVKIMTDGKEPYFYLARQCDVAFDIMPFGRPL